MRKASHYIVTSCLFDSCTRLRVIYISGAQRSVAAARTGRFITSGNQRGIGRFDDDGIGFQQAHIRHTRAFNADRWWAHYLCARFLPLSRVFFTSIVTTCVKRQSDWHRHYPRPGRARSWAFFTSFLVSLAPLFFVSLPGAGNRRARHCFSWAIIGKGLGERLLMTVKGCRVFWRQENVQWSHSSIFGKSQKIVQLSYISETNFIVYSSSYSL